MAKYESLINMYDNWKQIDNNVIYIKSELVEDNDECFRNIEVKKEQNVKIEKSILSCDKNFDHTENASEEIDLKIEPIGQEFVEVSKIEIYNKNTCDVDPLEISGTIQKENSTNKPDKSIICEICNRQLKNKRSLNAHMITHTKEKPHECDVCNKSFSFHYSMIQHKRIHTGYKPYTCTICEKKFANTSGFNAHKNTHDTTKQRYTCPVCNKGFSTNSNLYVHKLSHTNNKPFACEVCGRCFKRSTHLTEHRMIHADEKLFECNVCKKKFNFKKNLRTHQQIHNRNN